MPRASHRLDIVLVPINPDQEVDVNALRGLVAQWRGRGDLVSGGQDAIRVDIPRRVALYGNQQGGFAVRCPSSAENIVPAFNRAVTTWRAGGSRSLRCPSCGDTHPLESLEFAPPAAFAMGAIVLAGVATAAISGVARAEAEAVLGPLRVILRRVG